MSSPQERLLRLNLRVNTEQPEVLEGLDVLLKLGLISDSEVRQVCGQNLTCPLPVPVLQPIENSPEKLDVENVPVQTLIQEELTPATVTPKPPRKPIFQPLEALKAELSVRWLLFLGVFMVVMSSGLLAASQWEKFPAAGQYGILLVYTLLFFGVSLWANRQSNLNLTAQTLQIVTLLLVPVNFWAIDRFGLWSNFLEWLTVVVATITLTGVTTVLLKLHRPFSRLNLLNSLGLSFLHFGWKFSGLPVPLLACYTGTILTTLIILKKEYFSVSSPENTQSAWRRFLPYSMAGYALAILLFRAIFAVGVPVPQLGLAIGICGSLFVWLSQRETYQESSPISPWSGAGVALLLLGWVVSVWTQSWQALIISGLGIYFLGVRLLRRWQKIDLAAIYLIGLQAIFLIGKIIPAGVRKSAITTGVQLTAAQNTPGSLLSVTWLPYLVFMLWVNGWIYTKGKRELAFFGDKLALGFGIFLTILGSPNPSIRALNLLASTVILGFLTVRRKPVRGFLVYLTNLAGVLTVVSWINWFLPNLSLVVWAAICLSLMGLEWLFLVLGLRLKLDGEEIATNADQNSAWYLGCGLAGLSYLLLLKNLSIFLSQAPAAPLQWGFLWLLTPMLLTAVASRSSGEKRTVAGWLSVGALILAELLLFMLPGGRLLGAGIAVLLMFVNTHYLRRVNSAIITVGFAVFLLYGGLWQGLPVFPPLSRMGWLIVNAGTVIALWILCDWLSSIAFNKAENAPNKPLFVIYSKATNFWAIGLCLAELFILTVRSFGMYLGDLQPSLLAIIATAIITLTLFYQTWKNPTNWLIYGFGWALELLAVECLGFFGRSVVPLVVVNIALGLIFQLVGDWWHRRNNGQNLPTSLHIMPLLYGVMAGLLRWGIFTNWTGFSSLGLVLIAFGVGRRSPQLKFLVYLGLIGVTTSAYEILSYQIVSRPTGDKLIASAAMATSIMYAYRLLIFWLKDYLRLTENELKLTAHIHWFLGSYFLTSAVISPIQSGDLLGLGTGLILSRYAIMQGRHNPDKNAAEWWVYSGILEAAGLAIFLGYKFKIAALVLPWAAVIVSAIAYFVYALPWENWGWPKTPWLRSAIVIPTITAFLTYPVIQPISLLGAAAFYLFLAWLNKQIRITYLALFFLDWALFQWFWNIKLTDLLAQVSPPALCLLYIAAFDPFLKAAEQKQIRHLLRLLGAGVICFVALATSGWLVAGVVSLVAIFAGLALRIRAFLYVGTAVFLLNAFNQLVLLSLEYSFVKWIIGLLVGVIFIWIAATFETRREQILNLVQNWLQEWQEWQ
ncbi:DUF2157 domain-containing protein [Ancylothrix sp. C2]|uniref:DUF2157 domain-containing protein n=1 Tax=Ancylothrix sp. D3o TaxID=2953691 RepID=UPI0021BA7A91|nr:DUF2157 domain-containing protein [Ancylothrix sp. D3o]MCT7948555.1 DUF2157 domain-containing protein [Ancylothrix sp. D3o]